MSVNIYGFTLLRNGVKYDYSFRECLKSLEPICKSVYLALGESEDDTKGAVADLNFLKSFAALPEYRNSKNSYSVNTFAFRHILAKKKVVSMPPISIFHHNQFPEMPFFLTTSATHKGVSAAKVVATIDITAMYQGKFLPAKKKSVKEPLALFLNFNPMYKVIPKNTTTIIQSINSKTIISTNNSGKIIKFED